MTKPPSFHNYGKYSSDNYGAHSLCFEDAHGNKFWYSYQTLVAFRASGGAKVVRENIWSTTTGKHLNWIDGGNKKSRVSEDQFKEIFNSTFK